MVADEGMMAGLAGVKKKVRQTAIIALTFMYWWEKVLFTEYNLQQQKHENIHFNENRQI